MLINISNLCCKCSIFAQLVKYLPVRQGDMQPTNKVFFFLLNIQHCHQILYKNNYIYVVPIEMVSNKIVFFLIKELSQNKQNVMEQCNSFFLLTKHSIKSN